MEEIPEFETLAEFIEQISPDFPSLSYIEQDNNNQPIEERIRFSYNRVRRNWCINTKYQNKIVKIEGLFFLFYVDLSTTYSSVGWTMQYNPHYATAFIVLQPI